MQINEDYLIISQFDSPLHSPVPFDTAAAAVAQHRSISNTTSIQLINSCMILDNLFGSGSTHSLRPPIGPLHGLPHLRYACVVSVCRVCLYVLCRMWIYANTATASTLCHLIGIAINSLIDFSSSLIARLPFDHLHFISDSPPDTLTSVSHRTSVYSILQLELYVVGNSIENRLILYSLCD